MAMPDNDPAAPVSLWWQERSGEFLGRVAGAYNQALAARDAAARHAALGQALRQVRGEYDAFQREHGRNGRMPGLSEEARRELAALSEADRDEILEALRLLGEHGFARKIACFNDDWRRFTERLTKSASTAAARLEAEAEFLRRFLDMLLDFPTRRLLVYGSLAPGAAHADLLEALPGAWRPAVVHGEIDRERPYPMLRWRPDGAPHRVLLFESEALPGHYGALDAFEGEEYARILAPARLGEGWTVATVYAAAEMR